MKTMLLLVGIATTLIALSSCNSNYNTEFAPPGENPKYSDVYPDSINGFDQKVEMIKSEIEDVEGYDAIYGDKNIIISAYQTPSKVVADKYFKDEIVPVFDNMAKHSRGNINGSWYASGKEPNKKAYAWVNTNWIFVITADNDENFNSAIESFKFIAAK